MLRNAAVAAGVMLLAAGAAHASVPVTLNGSPESMLRQNDIARAGRATFFTTPQEVYAAVETGELVAVYESDHLLLHRISYPYVRPETRLFLERFSEQYHAACGEPLVVTSLTRPQLRQPKNAHELSVHPAGLAVDLRIPQNARCRSYLETTLLAKEHEGVLDVTRERTPPHYHVALFPDAYLEYIGENADPAPGWLSGAGGEGVIPGAHALRAGAADGAGEAEARTWGRWIGRLLTLPVRLVSRVFGG